MELSGWQQIAEGRGHELDGKLMVQFEMYPRQNREKTEKEGRPVFEDVEYVKIQTPGDTDNVVHRPVRDFDKQRFARQYAAWKLTGQQPSEGTPLEQWPGVTRAQVAELAFFGCRTVEHLANMSDANAQKFMGSAQLRQRARDYLERAKDGAIVVAMRAQLDESENELGAVKRQMAEMAAAMGDLRKQLQAATPVAQPAAPAPPAKAGKS